MAARKAGMHIRITKRIVSLVLAGALTLPSSVHAARSDWRELVVGHFDLFSTLSDSGTRKVALQLQGFEETVGEMLQTRDRLVALKAFRDKTAPKFTGE